MEFKLYKILQVPLFYNVQVFGFLVSQLPWPPSKDRPRTGLRAPWQDRRVRRRCPRLPEAVVVWRKRFRGFFLVKNKTSSDTVLTSYEKTQPPPPSWKTLVGPRAGPVPGLLAVTASAICPSFFSRSRNLLD